VKGVQVEVVVADQQPYMIKELLEAEPKSMRLGDKGGRIALRHLFDVNFTVGTRFGPNANLKPIGTLKAWFIGRYGDRWKAIEGAFRATNSKAEDDIFSHSGQ